MSTCGSPWAGKLYWCTARAWLLAGTVATPAWAGDPPTSAPNPMAAEGLRAYDAGRYEEANDKLSRALDSIGVPGLALCAARTNVQLKHWVRAAELYMLASRLNPSSSADISQLQVQHEAEKERSELLIRVPRMTIVVEGEDLDEVEITLDSERVPKALLGANQLVDPGHHVVVATRGGQLVTGELDILEGQHKTTTLHFARMETKDAPQQTLPSISTNTERAISSRTTTPKERSHPDPASGTPTLRVRVDDGFDGSAEKRSIVVSRQQNARAHDGASDGHVDNTQRNLGWVGLAIGAAGLVMGTTAGLMAVAKRSELEQSGRCVDANCSTDQLANVDSYNALRAWSTIGLVTGSLFGAAGLTLLLTVPRQESETSRVGGAVGRGTRRRGVLSRAEHTASSLDRERHETNSAATVRLSLGLGSASLNGWF